jgi:hypothetical protein
VLLAARASLTYARIERQALRRDEMLSEKIQVFCWKLFWRFFQKAEKLKEATAI